PVDAGRRDAEVRFAVPARGPLEDLAGRCSVAAEPRMRQRIEGIVEEQATRIRYYPSRPHSSIAQLVPVVEHAGNPPLCLSLKSMRLRPALTAGSKCQEVALRPPDSTSLHRFAGGGKIGS